jgi:hypothetical protein
MQFRIVIYRGLKREWSFTELCSHKQDSDILQLRQKLQSTQQTT